MANHKGSEGVVKIGSNTLAELKSYSINHTTNTIEDTTLTDTSKTFQAGSSQYDGSADCFWDETDSSGQGALTAGAQVTLYVYPGGSHFRRYGVFGQCDCDFTDCGGGVVWDE